MDSDITNDILKALLTATNDQKKAALKVLRSEPEPMRAEPYLLLKEVAKQLNVHYTTLWKWGVQGHDLGGRRRFRMSEVQAYLNSDAFRKRVQELKERRKKVGA
jgi:excisionase family DNA binding protein